MATSQSIYQFINIQILNLQMNCSTLLLQFLYICCQALQMAIFLKSLIFDQLQTWIQAMTIISIALLLQITLLSLYFNQDVSLKVSRLMIFLKYVYATSTAIFIAFNNNTHMVVLFLFIKSTSQEMTNQTFFSTQLNEKHLLKFELIIILIFTTNILSPFEIIFDTVILLLEIFYELFSRCLLKQPVFFLKKSKGTFNDNEKIVGIEVKQQESILTPEMNKNKAQSIDFRFPKVDSEDELILKKIPWIQNQQVIVFNETLNFVYMNIYLGIYQKKGVKKNDNDYTSSFLEVLISHGCKNVKNMFQQQKNSQYSETIQSEFSGSLVYNSQICNKFKLKEKKSIQTFLTKIFQDCDRWKQQILLLSKIEHGMLDFQKCQIKVFVQTLKKKNYVFFLFEQVSETSNQSNNDFDVQSHLIANFFQTLLIETTNYLNLIFTLVQIAQAEQSNAKRFLSTMKLSSIKFKFFINSIRDHLLCLQNQLFLKISAFKVSDLLEDLYYIFEEPFRSRDTSLFQQNDIPENMQIVYNDYERVKQVMVFLITLCLRYSSKSQIRLEMKMFNAQGIILTLKESGIQKVSSQLYIIQDEKMVQLLLNLTKNFNQLLKSSTKILDLQNPMELQICFILSWTISGSLKRGLEFSTEQGGTSSFSLFIETSPPDSKSIINSGNEVGQIKVLGQNRYFETSLSMRLASLQENSDDKLLSLFSLKPSDSPFDLQSAYFSHLSKVRQESKQFVNSGSIFSRVQQESFVQSNGRRPTSKKPNSNSASKDSISESGLDFGPEESLMNMLEPPLMEPKLLKSVIKFRLNKPCCSKVLIVDNDHYSVLVMAIFFDKQGIKTDKAFNGQQAVEMITSKAIVPCHCGNRFYLLYFIEVNIPILSGVDLVKYIKEQIKQLIIDRGFTIAVTTYIDLNAKLELFRSGIDYCISKPFDLFEISAITQYISFDK